MRTLGCFNVVFSNVTILDGDIQNVSFSEIPSANLEPN